MIIQYIRRVAELQKQLEGARNRSENAFASKVYVYRCRLRMRSETVIEQPKTVAHISLFRVAAKSRNNAIMEWMSVALHDNIVRLYNYLFVQMYALQ